jgi:hypothetical protein
VFIQSSYVAGSSILSIAGELPASRHRPAAARRYPPPLGRLQPLSVVHTEINSSYQPTLPRPNPFLPVNLSYEPPWAHYLSGYQDQLLGGPLGVLDLGHMTPDGVGRKDYGGGVLR